MSKRGVVKVLCSVIVLVAVLNLVGWGMGIEVFKGWVPGTITMKVTTALAFLAVGGLFFSLSSGIDVDVKLILVFFTSNLLLFLMGPFLFSIFTGEQTGFESLFIEDSQLIPMGRMPGWPSIGTVLGFLFIAGAGFSYAFSAGKRERVWKVLGVLVSVMGVIALFGHFLDVPLLYYNWGDYNSMAINTATLFALAGICIFLLNDEK